MSMTVDEQKRIEAYLRRLSGRLQGFNDEDVREIIEELRSHILDKVAARGEVTAAGVNAALAALGSPEELASLYITANVVAQTEVSRSPLQVLKSLFRWASLSAVGIVVLLTSISGYSLGVIFILCALLKPFHPQTTGLWISRDSTGDLAISLSLGLGNAPVHGKDVLSWWIVPIGLLGGGGLVMVTTRFAVWCARSYRRSHLLPRS